MVVPWISSTRPCLAKSKQGVAIKATKKKIAPIKGKPRHVRLQGQPAARGGLQRQPTAPAGGRIGKSKQASKSNSLVEVDADIQVNERDMCLLCGSVDEIDADHARRHACLPKVADGNFHCPRCLWIFCKADIERVAPWVGPRPRHLGGAWALGCRICDSAKNHKDFKARREAHIDANSEHGFYKQAISRSGKWCKYQIRVGGSSWNLKHRLQAHACSDLHRLCAEVVSSPQFLLGSGSAAPLRKISPDVELVSRVHEAIRSKSDTSGEPAVSSGVSAVSSGQPAASSGQAAVSQLPSLRTHVHPATVFTGSIQDPFRGNVPQEADFVDVWADSTSTLSFRAQVNVHEKRGSSTVVERRRKRNILGIEAEVVRERCRKRCFEATSISLAVDECDTRKIIRIRCDTPEAPYKWDGTIGVLRRRYDVTDDVARQIKEDHAAHNLVLLDQTLRAFFTPLPSKVLKANSPGAVGMKRLPGAAGTTVAACGAKRKRAPQKEEPQCDEVALQGFRKKVRILCADGGSGERRALFLAAKHYFPNVQLVIRDPAHGLRIATCKPMQLQSYFKEVYEELINKRHALIPDIQNSGKWRQILHGLQQRVLHIPGHDRSGALQIVLKHLSLAKTRMDSCADPLAKLCLMLLPVALLLAFIASDERCDADQRERALIILKKFQPKFMIGAGVSADWGLITLQFLRLFDRLDHDIANSSDELEEFSEVVEACFVKGGIFCRVPASDSDSQRRQDKHAEFITERVRKQTQKRCVFHCGEKEVVVWGPPSIHDLRSLKSSLQLASRVMLDRVVAELEGLRMRFRCLAVRRLVQHHKAVGADKAKKRELLSKSLQALGEAFRLDNRILQLEYWDAAPVVVQLYIDALQNAQKQESDSVDILHRWFDNRPFWGNLLDNKFVDKVFPGRVVAFTVLPKLIRIYYSLLDGESQVERDLGLLRAYQTAGRGRSSDLLLDDQEMLKMNGPKTNDEVRGTYSFQCVTLWRKVHGIIPRRRKIKMRQPAAPKKGKRETFVAAKRAVLRASVRAKQLCKGAAKTSFGVTADFFQQSAPASDGADEAWELGLKKFQNLTKVYAIRNRMMQKGREGFQKVVPRHSTKALVRTSFSSIRLLAYLPCLDTAARGAVPDGYEIRSGTHACKTADFVVLDELERLHTEHADLAWVIHLLYIVARGLPLTTLKCALALKGDLDKIKPEFVREHMPLFKERFLFLVPKQLNAKYPDVASALRGIEKMEGSAWRVEVRDSDDVREAVLATAPGAASGAPQSEHRVPPKASASTNAPGATSGASRNGPRVAPKAPATRNVPGAASGAPQRGPRVPPKASATRSASAAPKNILGKMAVAKRQACPKKRGRPKKKRQETLVPVPDLQSMWTWLQSNRLLRNARCTTMFWRDHRPGKI